MNEWVVLTVAVISIIISSTIITYIMYNLQEVFDKIKSLFKRKPKYRVGQKVRVRGDLINGELYGEKKDKRRFYSSMVKHVGNVVTISFIDDTTDYLYIKEDDEDTWIAEMLETLKIKKEDAFEALLHGHIDDEEYKAIMNVGGVVKWHSRLVKKLK